MRWIDLRTGYTCNNRCRFCDQAPLRDARGGPTGAPLDAPLESLRAALLAARDPTGPTGVWLAGGEVTTRRDLPALVRAAREAGYARVGLQTNGRILAAPGAAAALRQEGLTDAVVAIHAATAPVHDWLTGADGAFAQATAGARRLAQAGVTLHVATVMTRTTTDTLPRIAALAARLGARTQRWIVAREQGAAVPAARELVPRLALLTDPLLAALDLGREARVEGETVGVPLCHLGRARAAAADGPDHPGARRVFPAGWEEAPRPTRYGAACAACAVRAACPGVDAAYLDRWGEDELTALGPDGAPLPPPPGGWGDTGWGTAAPIAPPTPSPRAPVAPPTPSPRAPVALAVSAPCSLACAGCEWRGDADAPPPVESGRALRQRLVRAAAHRERGVRFTGGSPWENPHLPALVREATRLGFASVTVRGPAHPLADLDAPAFDRLAGLTAVEVPTLPDAHTHTPGAAARAEAGLARLVEAVPDVRIERYPPSAPHHAPDPPFRSDRPVAACQARRQT